LRPANSNGSILSILCVCVYGTHLRDD